MIMNKCFMFIFICCSTYFAHGKSSYYGSNKVNRQNNHGILTAPKFVESPENVTVVLGDEIYLPCVAEGNPKPFVIWYSRRVGRLQSVPGSSFVIKPDGIHWSNITKADEDWYRCSARNRKSVAHSQWAYLKVLAKTEIFEYPGGYSVNYGTQLLLKCVALGDPLPEIVWFKDGEKVLNGIEFTPFQQYVRSVLTVNATNTSNFTCSARNLVQDVQYKDERTFTLSVVRPIDEIPEVLGFCSRYEGRTCLKHLNPSELVWYNSSYGNSDSAVDSLEIWSEIIGNFREPCRSVAEKLLCRFSYPECHLNENSRQKGLPLCRQDCLAVERLFCINEWLLLSEMSKERSARKSMHNYHLPICDNLPNYSKGEHLCSNIDLTSVRREEITYDCVRGNGRWYLGTANKTESGAHCQRWDTHENSPPDVFPEVKDAENYCRNPGGIEPRPWCYTTNPEIRWQYCDVPLCGGNSALEENFSLLESDVVLSPLILIAGGGAILFLVLIVALCVLATVKLARVKKADDIPCQNNTIDLSKLHSNAAFHQTTISLNPKLEKLQYDRNNIVYIRDLGQGAFGRVFQGRAAGLIAGEEEITIAVKVLKDEATQDMMADFEREASTLAEFDHPNIVKLLGVCAVGRPMCLIFEYMDRGDLNEFLRSCSPSNYIVRTSTGSVFTDVKLSQEDLMWISLQIAAGMVYLASRKFVHRDLATRNCLIGQDLTVKIADFGLSQKMYLSDYYCGDDRDAIPIRWMPLESILYNKYTPESDVWAFGVCLWEIFSFAVQPYFGMTHEEVVTFLKEGGMLCPPDGCPPEIYDLMRWCWQRRPNHRPPFSVLHQALSDIMAGRPTGIPSVEALELKVIQESAAIASSDTLTRRPCSCLPPERIASTLPRAVHVDQATFI